MRALVGGYFSFDGRVTTAGDLLACQVAVGWLRRAGVPCDVAMAAKYGEGVDWEQVDPAEYTHLVWVCGPVTRGPKQTALRERFRHARMVAVDVSLLDELEPWNPYDAVVERDSARVARPDISFLARDERIPVVGVCLISGQREYGERGRHDEVETAVERLVASRAMAVVDVDTVIKPGKPGRRSPGEVEALLGHVDAVVTNRLHGLVLSIKQQVPVVAIDSVEGGAKVRRQAEAIGWPAVLAAESLDDAQLQRALDWCLSDEGRTAAREARERAIRGAAALEAELIAALRGGGE